MRSNALRDVLVIVAMILLGIGVFVFIYLGGWWVTKDSTDRQGEVNRHSYGYQQSARDELTRTIGELNTANVNIAAAPDGLKPALRAQRHAVLAQACRAGSQLVGDLEPEQANFVIVNCAAGAPAANAPIEAS
jgi:hypothetical protein